MTINQDLYSEPNSFPIPPEADESRDAEDALAAFDDCLWQTAEAVIASGASSISISIIAETASLVRRQSEMFASILSEANHMKSLGAAGGPTCSRKRDKDIGNTQERLISQLRRDLAKL